ncbi:MAG TPA: winged helix-turn-helix domain-containing protein [Stellaceae bacterium]|nr:winged helix-turn-helix domain-containing protein [Stellaceae bacterium]
MNDIDPLIAHMTSRRQALGWSLDELGRRCGIDRHLLARWEGGLASPRLDAVQSWSGALGLTVAAVASPDAPRRRLEIDWEQRRVLVDGAPVRLTPMEWRGLERLAYTPGELVSHRALYQHLYGDTRPYRAQSTAIRVLITKLRRLLPLRIEARWGKGYIVSPIESSCGAAADDAPDGLAAAGGLARDVRDKLAIEAPPPAEAARPGVLDLSEARVRHVAPPPRLAVGRAEELGVIERFLAERGATHCPDAATIQHAPLPTLVWDKTKRKWVRPPLIARAAR